MNDQKIKSVEKGWGEGTIFFSTHPGVAQIYKVDEIKREMANTFDGPFDVYRGYVAGKPKFEMGITADVTTVFETP